MKKRIVSLLLAMIMLFSALPVGAFATEAEFTAVEERPAVVETEEIDIPAEEPGAETEELGTETEEPGEEPVAEPSIHIHNYVPVVTDPTCSVDGFTTYTCDCGDTYTADTVPATGHTEQTVPAVAPTCTETGLTEGKVCSDCGKVLTAQKVVKATGHNYVNDVCTGCGKVRPAAPEITVSNVAKSGKVQLKWEAVEGAAKYRIYRCDTKTGTYKWIWTQAGTTYTNTNAEVGATYYYYVVAVGADGTLSEAGNIVSGTCKLTRPVITASNVEKSGKVRLTWEPVEGAVKYQIFRADSQDGTYTRVWTQTATTYVNTKAVAGEKYYYYVVAVAAKSAANSAPSAVQSRTCDLPRPVVKASNVEKSGKIRLNWDAVEGAVKYRVYRATEENGEYKNVFTTEGTQYTHTGGEAGVRYYYKVKAIAADTNANSAYSATLTRICDLPAPTGLSIDRNEYGKPMLSWNAVEGAVAYEIYRSTTGETGTFKRVYTATATAYNNTGAEVSTTYYYKVKAIAADTNANSALCEAKSVTTTAGRKMQVITSGLNVRTGPGTEYGVVTSLSLGERVMVQKVNNGWGKIEGGWISLDHVIPVVDTSGNYAYTYATYTTSAGSSYNRDVNLAVACRAINGTILMPGESFSFNGVVGQRTASKGYKPATVIVGNEYSTSYGGGVCQVSSTVFNAVLLGNLKITERNQHSLSVAYLPKGRDAMVNWGTSDFKFVNNSKYCIKIQAYASGGTVTVTLLTREAGVSPASNVSLSVTKSGGSYRLTRKYKGSVNYQTWSTY